MVKKLKIMTKAENVNNMILNKSMVSGRLNNSGLESPKLYDLQSSHLKFNFDLEFGIGKKKESNNNRKKLDL